MNTVKDEVAERLPSGRTTLRVHGERATTPDPATMGLKVNEPGRLAIRFYTQADWDLLPRPRPDAYEAEGRGWFVVEFTPLSLQRHGG